MSWNINRTVFVWAIALRIARQSHTTLALKKNVVEALVQLDYPKKCVGVHPDTVFSVIPQLIGQVGLYLVLLRCYILAHK